MIFASALQFIQRRQKFQSCFCQRILHNLRRLRFANPTINQSVHFQFAQRFRQHKLRNTRDTAPQLVVEGIFFFVQKTEGLQ